MSTDNDVIDYSNELALSCAFLEDLGVCLKSDVRAVYLFGNTVFLKDCENDDINAVGAESLTECEHELLKHGTSVFTLPLPYACFDCRAFSSLLSIHEHLDMNHFHVTRDSISLAAESPIKNAERLAALSSSLPNIFAMMKKQEKRNPDIIAEYFGR